MLAWLVALGTTGQNCGLDVADVDTMTRTVVRIGIQSLYSRCLEGGVPSVFWHVGLRMQDGKHNTITRKSLSASLGPVLPSQMKVACPRDSERDKNLSDRDECVGM